MLGGIGVDYRDAGLEVVDQDDTGLPAGERRSDPLGVLGRGHAPDQRGFDAVGQLLTVGDQDGRGERVVLGLTDQVRGDVLGVGAVVGQYGDLGRPGLGVDADDALQQALGRGDVDVARAGHHGDRFTDHGASIRSAIDAGFTCAVGKHGDRLGAADGVDLVDAEQPAGSQDGGVGIAGKSSGVVPLWRTGDRDRDHTRDLGGDDVHDDAAGVDRDPAGDVEADPVDRQPALGDGSAGHHARGRVGPALVPVNDACPPDGLIERRADLGVEALKGRRQDCGRHPQLLGSDPIETLPQVTQGVGSTMAHVLTDRSHHGQRCLDVELGPGQHLTKGACVQRTAPQIDPGDHHPSLGCRARRPGVCPASGG